MKVFNRSAIFSNYSPGRQKMSDIIHAIRIETFGTILLY